VPGGLLSGYEPYGGLSELEWEHAYVQPPAVDGGRPQYSWPSSESFPEGGLAPGEAVVLEPEDVVERIGDEDGRMLTPRDVLFGDRSLPPSYRERGFRRYRVLRRLPVWRSVSAPWFGQPGGAPRYRATHPVSDLVGLGYLVEITGSLAAAEAPTVRLPSSVETDRAGTDRTGTDRIGTVRTERDGE
jgi:hypothetical protein